MRYLFFSAEQGLHLVQYIIYQRNKSFKLLSSLCPTVGYTMQHFFHSTSQKAFHSFLTKLHLIEHSGNLQYLLLFHPFSVMSCHYTRCPHCQLHHYITSPNYPGQCVCPHHVQFAIVGGEGWKAVGGHGAGGQGVVGVHSRTMLVIPVGCDGRVEAWPEHPQVDGPWEETQAGWPRD